MKLKGHTDNVRAVLLNRDGTEVQAHIPIFFKYFQSSIYPFIQFFSVCLGVQMVLLGCGLWDSNVV